MVHGDLSPDNILVKFNKNGIKSPVESIKIVDYGSSYMFNEEMGISDSVPEYLPPEILLFKESIRKADDE